MSNKNLKENLFERIKSTKNPVAIFDLDGTVFNVNFRHIAIFESFVKDPEMSKMFPEYCKKITQLSENQFKYSIEGTLNSIGIGHYSEHSAHFIKAVETYWFKHFFTDEYVIKDKPFSKALECVNFFHKNGVHIVYLSGRDIPNMSKGTIQSLDENGFPHTGHGITMCLKPAYGLDDLLFKKESLNLIKSEGEVIATFDNEPANVKMFIEEFPDAYHFHYNSQYARALDLKGKHFYLINNFEEMGF